MKKIRLIKITTMVSVLLGGLYYIFFTLDHEPIDMAVLIKKYSHQPVENMSFSRLELDEQVYQFSYTTFDGSIVKGKMVYPKEQKESYPVILGLHAMGRSVGHWWSDAVGDVKTVTQINKIAEYANEKGYVVIAIDARNHGSRWTAQRTIKSIMINLLFLGNKEYYVNMIHHTVLDYRVLLDWVSQQGEFKQDDIRLVGYSMGAQMGLILAAMDERVNSVMAIVPPYLDDKTALVAPKNAVSLLKDKNVYLVTANDDEDASEKQNQRIFELIPSENKRHLIFDGGHILPDGYVNELHDWF